jgi:hypothetical protein
MRKARPLLLLIWVEVFFINILSAMARPLKKRA